MQNFFLLHSAVASVCGAISGIILFIALSGGFSGAVKSAAGFFFEPVIYAAGLSLAAAGLHIVLLRMFSAFFSIDKAKASSDAIKIIALPSVLYVAAFFLAAFEPKIAAVKLLVLGNIYIPFSGYTNVGAAGYSFLTLFGTVFTLQILSFTLYFSYRLTKTRIFGDAKALQKIVFVQLFVMYAGTGFYTTFSYPPTGDEPYYLLVAEAVIKGKGLNLESLYADAGTYAKIYPGELDSSFRVHNAPGKDGGIYTVHPPAISFLLLPFYLLLGRFGAQLAVNACAALLGAMLFKTALQISGKSRESYLLTIVFFLCAPLFVNSSLVLTELPAALLILYCCGELLKEKKNGFLYFISLSLLPWLHMKFAVVSIAGAVVYSALKIFRREKPLSGELKGIAAVAVSAALFAAVYFYIFGAKAGSLYDKQDFKFVLDSAYSIKAFFAVLFDRNYGLFIYAPVYIFVFWGMIETALKKEYKLLLPLVIILPYAAVYLFWNDWTGSMTPARQLVPVLPVAALYSLILFREKSRLFAAVAAISLIIGWMLAAVPLLRYASSRDKIFRALEAKAPGFMWFFPDFNAILTPALAVAAVYLLLIIAGFFYIRALKKE